MVGRSFQDTEDVLTREKKVVICTVCIFFFLEEFSFQESCDKHVLID